jgi:hypothetical protein
MVSPAATIDPVTAKMLTFCKNLALGGIAGFFGGPPFAIAYGLVVAPLVATDMAALAEDNETTWGSETVQAALTTYWTQLFSTEFR